MEDLKERFLLVLAKDVIAKWKELATNLGMSNSDVYIAEHNNLSDVIQQAFSLLIAWKNKTTSEENKRKLLAIALSKTGYSDLIEKHGLPDPGQKRKLSENEETDGGHKISDGNELDVFISYEHKSKEKVFSLYKKLEKHGFKCWMDDSNTRAGDDLTEEIVSGIKKGKVFLACLTSAYGESKYCKKETQTAFDQNKKIIPILLEKSNDCWPPYLKTSLSLIYGGLKYMSLAESNDIDIDELKQSIRETSPSQCPKRPKK